LWFFYPAHRGRVFLLHFFSLAQWAQLLPHNTIIVGLVNKFLVYNTSAALSRQFRVLLHFFPVQCFKVYAVLDGYAGAYFLQLGPDLFIAKHPA
jgi:hypothetical protein